MTQHILEHFEIPMELLPGILTWSVFSEEKQLDFNGYVFKTTENQLLIIDPPTAGDAVFQAVEAYGVPTLIVITNRDHERESNEFRMHFHIPVIAHELDAPLMMIAPEQTCRDGDILPGDLDVVHLPHQKSPGEFALYQQHRGLLLVGDALISKGYRKLGMLPAEKYADPALAFQSLKILADLHPGLEVLLTGDGPPVLGQAQDVIETFLLAGF